MSWSWVPAPRAQQALDAPERALIEMKGSLTIDPAVWTAPERVGP